MSTFKKTTKSTLFYCRGGNFREYFFTKNNLIVFGELINYLLFRNYVTIVVIVAVVDVVVT